ncbi:hypothetical protein O1611_g176 [Lasiodiplodia mahajangana]|uniref:Uncharacterized protein n=1 Tax=Lasiodiplodia mahajangana TaxID=1108764 RepID=A0ACC2K0X7_9PEZI|nr:hypothetical protein O1611_g176 [Lasiodiplodia mahajangana]
MEEEEKNHLMSAEEGGFSRNSVDFDHPSGDTRQSRFISIARKKVAVLLQPPSCNLSAFIIVIIVQFLLVWVLLASSRTRPSNGSSSPPFAYSPVLNHIDLPFSPKQVSAQRYHNQSIYVDQPSPEVDAAWDRIQEAMIWGISKDDMRRVGKDPGKSVKYDPAWGFGDDLYMVEVDVFHQIHCLNVLRKSLVTNYDYYWGRKWGFEPPIDFRTHLRHCTSLLLQNLMCHADVEVITHEWNEEQPWPFPDFGVMKQCRDFDALLQWAEANTLPNARSRYMKHRPPTGSVRTPMESDPDNLIGEATGSRGGEDTQRICIKDC